MNCPTLSPISHVLRRRSARILLALIFAAISLTSAYAQLPPPSSDVSTIPIKSVLPVNSQIRLYVHLYGWFGSAAHTAAGYNSADPMQVEKQLADMIARGINGAVLNWHGSSDITDQTALTFKIESEKSAAPFEFAIEVDGDTLAACAATANCDVAAKLTADLKYVLSTYAESTAYMKYQGRPVVFLCGTDSYKLDLKAIQASLAGNPVFIVGSGPATGVSKTIASASAIEVTHA